MDHTRGITLIDCPVCDTTGTDAKGKPCEHCNDGRFELRQCPRDYLGSDFMSAVNIAAMSGKGDWPVAGGLLDQSAWFIYLVQSLRNEQNQIEMEQAERRGS